MKSLLLLLGMLLGTAVAQAETETDAQAMQAQIGAALTAAAFAGQALEASDDKRYEYAPSEAVSISVRTEMAHYIAQDPLLNDTLRNDFQRYFADTDLMTAIAPEIARRGYPVDSVATAMTTWLLVNYEIIHDVAVTPAQAEGVYRQITGLFATLPDFQTATDADKQRMAEGLYWIAHLQKFANDQAKTGKAGFTQEDVMRQSRAIFKEYGLLLDQLKLDDTGFTRRDDAQTP